MLHTGTPDVLANPCPRGAARSIHLHRPPGPTNAPPKKTRDKATGFPHRPADGGGNRHVAPVGQLPGCPAPPRAPGAHTLSESDDYGQKREQTAPGGLRGRRGRQMETGRLVDSKEAAVPQNHPQPVQDARQLLRSRWAGGAGQTGHSGQRDSLWGLLGRAPFPPRWASGFPCPGLKPACSPAPRDVSRGRTAGRGSGVIPLRLAGAGPGGGCRGASPCHTARTRPPGTAPHSHPNSTWQTLSLGSLTCPSHVRGAAASRDLLGDSLRPGPSAGKGFTVPLLQRSGCFPPACPAAWRGPWALPPSLPAPRPPPVDSFPQSQASGLALLVHGPPRPRGPVAPLLSSHPIPLHPIAAAHWLAGSRRTVPRGGQGTPSLSLPCGRLAPACTGRLRAPGPRAGAGRERCWRALLLPAWAALGRQVDGGALPGYGVRSGPKAPRPAVQCSCASPGACPWAWNPEQHFGGAGRRPPGKILQLCVQAAWGHLEAMCGAMATRGATCGTGRSVPSSRQGAWLGSLQLRPDQPPRAGYDPPSCAVCPWARDSASGLWHLHLEDAPGPSWRPGSQRTRRPHTPGPAGKPQSKQPRSTEEDQRFPVSGRFTQSLVARALPPHRVALGPALVS